MARRKAPRRTVQDASLTEQIDKYFRNTDDALYADALMTLLTRSNTILSGRDIQCALSANVQIAATDGSTVFFSVSHIAALIRGLRISKRIPTLAEYKEAIDQIQRKNWHASGADTAHGRWIVGQNYLYRKFVESPHLFPQVICDGESPCLVHIGACFSQPLPYESFVAKLQVEEMRHSIRSFATLRGLNYHELSHCLYTPSANASLRKQITSLGQDRIYNSQEGLEFLYKLYGFKKPKGFGEPLKNPEHQLKISNAWGIVQQGSFWHKAWNTLEDQRIESLFVAKFPTARHFFTSAVLRYIASYKPTDLNGNVQQGKKRKDGASYVLLYGRRYLSKSLRNKYRDLLKEDFGLTNKAIAECEALIDKYRDLSSFKSQADIAVAIEIVWEFGLWILKNIQDVSQLPEPEGGFDHERQTAKSNDGKRDVEDAQETRQQQEERWESEEDEEDSDDQGDSDGGEDEESDDDSDSDSDSNSNSDSDGDGDESEDSDADGDSDSDSDSDSDGDSSGNSKNDDPNKSDSESNSNGSDTTAGTGSGEPQKDELRKLLKQAEDAISEDAIRQIQTLHETVKQVRFNRFFSNLHKNDAVVATPVLYRSLANAISTTLSKLRSDRDNQWERGSSVGVVNALRYAESRGTHTDFFDEWQEDGDERPDAEIVVLLDLSGSMNTSSFTQAKRYYGTSDNAVDNALANDLAHTGVHTLAYEASCAMWAIKYACQRNDILCSVIGYSDNALALYGSEDTVAGGTTALFSGISGTHPKEALFYARSVLEKSDAKHKILVSLSDGEWFIDHDSLKQVTAIRKLGGQTVFIQLPSSIDYGDADSNGKRTSVVPRYSDAGNKVGAKLGFYCHEHHIQVPDAQALTKKIGAILMKAVSA